MSETVNGQHDIPVHGEETSAAVAGQTQAENTQAPTLEIDVPLSVTTDEVNNPDPMADRFARNISKQILADELNEALSQNGLPANVTVEELSCNASAEIRRRQKANAKLRAQRKRRNKRK